MNKRYSPRPSTLLAILTPILVTACSSLGAAPRTDAAQEPATASPSANSAAERTPNGRPAKPGPLAAGGAARLPERDDAGTDEPAGSIPGIDLTPQLLFQLLMSEIAAQRGQLGSATKTYLSLARETRDPRLARRATELSLSAHALDSALPAAELWYELSPASTMAGRTLESLWLSTGKLTQAEPLMSERRGQAKADKRLPEFYRQTERALARVSDKPAALRLLERIAAKDQNLTEARLALASTARAAKDGPRAVAEAKAALALDPDNEQTAISAAQSALVGTTGNSAALEILDSFLKRRPKSIEARFSYARLLASEGRKTDARAQFELALAQEPDSPAILFSLAQIAYQTEQKDVARDYLMRFVSLPTSVQRDNNPAYLFLGQIAEERKSLQEAANNYAKVGAGEQYLDARIRGAIVTGQLGKVDTARELLNTTTVGSARERARLTAAEAQVLRNADRTDEAFKVLDVAVAKQPDNADLLYDHAMAAERIDKVAVMEQSLRKVISLRPDNAHAYNALGYTLADRNERLAEAEKLIRKALELSPDDPHILDSLGWLKFRQGKLDEAEKHLRQALSKSEEPEIIVHLGEVLHKLGRADEARQLWAKAMSSDPKNETLRKTLARLNVDL